MFPRGIDHQVHSLTDARGQPLRFILAASQASDIIADKAYDSNDLRTLIAKTGAEAVIPSNRTRKVLIPHDAVAYRLRNRIERFFNKLEHFRRIAIRYDRRAFYFLAAIHLASAIIYVR